MSIPESLSILLQGSPQVVREHIAHFWDLSHDSHAAIVNGIPEEQQLFDLINDCGREERWTLFDVLDLGGVAPANLYPRRTCPREGTPLEFNIDELRARALLFHIRNDNDEEFYIIAEELRRQIARYREQVLILKLIAIRRDLELSSQRYPQIELPEHIRPEFALSLLVATGDPEGFRLPLSRAFGIPEFFPAKVKSTLKQLLHDFYLLFLPLLGKMDPKRIYSLERVVTLAMGLASLLSHYHSGSLDSKLCRDEEKRPFASANMLLSGARRSLWRSFLVLLFNQFITPVGGSLILEGEHLQVFASAFDHLDLEVPPSRWLRRTLRELSLPVS